MVKKNNWIWLVLMLLSFMLIVMCCLFAAKGIKYINNSKSLIVQEEEAIDKSDPNWFIKGNYIYAFETCYAGKPFLSGRLFKYPFKKTDAYIMNKEYINQITTSGAEHLTDIAKETVMELFNVSYRNIDLDSENILLKKNLANGISTVFAGGTEYSGRDETINNLAEWFITNELTTEASFTTDKSLVYYDEHRIYVRGQLLLKVFRCKDMDKLAQTLGFGEMEAGKQYSLVLEISMIPQMDKDDYETYQISGISVLENAEK